MQTLVGATVSQRTSWYYPGSYKLSALFLKETYISAFHRVCVAHVCTCLCVFGCIPVCTCECWSLCVLHVCICSCVFGYVPVCTYECWSLCACVACVHMFVCVWAYACMYMCVLVSLYVCLSQGVTLNVLFGHSPPHFLRQVL